MKLVSSCMGNHIELTVRNIIYKRIRRDPRPRGEYIGLVRSASGASICQDSSKYIVTVWDRYGHYECSYSDTFGWESFGTASDAYDWLIYNYGGVWKVL